MHNEEPTAAELQEIDAELESIHRDMQKQVAELRQLRELIFSGALFMPKGMN